MTGMQTYMTIGGNAEAFAESWADGLHGLAVQYALRAETLYRAEVGPDIEAAKANNPRIVWPIPGCPEADETVGWAGWYGGYGGTGA